MLGNIFSTDFAKKVVEVKWQQDPYPVDLGGQRVGGGGQKTGGQKTGGQRTGGQKTEGQKSCHPSGQGPKNPPPPKWSEGTNLRPVLSGPSPTATAVGFPALPGRTSSQFLHGRDFLF